MRFTEEAMEKATAAICVDAKWKAIYESAPDGAKKRLRVAFWGSEYMREGEDLDAYRTERERIEREDMTREDALYLAQRFTVEPGKTHYKELAEKIARRPMMTDDKLDTAIATMVSLLSDTDRALVEESQKRYDRCEDGYFTKEIFWKAVGSSASGLPWATDRGWRTGTYRLEWASQARRQTTIRTDMRTITLRCALSEASVLLWTRARL